MRRIAILLLILGSGCSSFPELDELDSRIAPNAAYPRLLPLDELTHGPEPTLTQGEASQLIGRVAALRARAARLRQIRVIGSKTRARMQAGVSR